VLREMEKMSETIGKNAVNFTRELIRFNTINPPGNEDACARWLGGILEAAGYRIDWNEFAPGRTNLIATLPGNGDKLPLALSGHIDVVPLGAAPWSVDPFAAEVKDGRIYGRGSTDMKSGVAVCVAAAVELAKLKNRASDVVVVISAGEEIGCAGAYYMAEQKLLPQAGALLVAEPTSNYPLLGHKGIMWLEAITSGVTAHGAMPELGDNAVYKAARAVGKLENFDFGATHPAMGAPSLNVGTLHGGMNCNSVPDKAVIGIDIRTIPNQPNADALARVKEVLGPEVEIKVKDDKTSVYTSPEVPWVQQVFDVVEETLGERPEPETVNYFTDAGALTTAMGNVPTIIFGPGEVDMLHKTDEFCLVHRVEEGAAMYLEIGRRWLTEA